MHHLSKHHSTQLQYTNCRCKFYCCYLCLLNSTLSFLHKVIVLKPISFHFQTKDSDTYACICALMVIKWWLQKLEKQPTFVPIFYNMFLYWKAIWFIVIAFSASKFYSGGLKKTTIYHPCRPFLLESNFIMINKLIGIGITFCSYKYFSLWKILCKQMFLLEYVLFLLIW